MNGTMHLGETGSYKSKDSWFILPSTNAESSPATAKWLQTDRRARRTRGC